MPNIETIDRRVKKIEGGSVHPPLIVWEDRAGIFPQSEQQEIKPLPGQEILYLSWDTGQNEGK